MIVAVPMTKAPGLVEGGCSAVAKWGLPKTGDPHVVP